jgi:hypothetical protein
MDPEQFQQGLGLDGSHPQPWATLFGAAHKDRAGEACGYTMPRAAL